MGQPGNFPSSITEGVKINCVSRETREGRVFWLKRRRRIALPIMKGANLFFFLAKAPVRALCDLDLWRRWEVSCFNALHGPEGFVASEEGDRSVAAPEMPGRNLTRYLDGGTLTPAMAAAAGRELRRAHGWFSEELGALWSHGDPHAGNYIYDQEADRARIIDFEVMHNPALSPEERQADDVFVFLQDMIGRIAREKWLPCAEGFLTGYDRPELLYRVWAKLALPGVSLERLWWRVRASFLPKAEIDRRLEMLRQSPLLRDVHALSS